MACTTGRGKEIEPDDARTAGKYEAAFALIVWPQKHQHISMLNGNARNGYLVPSRGGKAAVFSGLGYFLIFNTVRLW